MAGCGSHWGGGQVALAMAGSSSVPVGESVWSWAIAQSGGPPTRKLFTMRISELLSEEDVRLATEAADAEAESQIEAGVVDP